MQKRGQVTIFLIVGILLVAAFAVFLYISSSIQTRELSGEDGELPLALQLREQVRSFVESCIEEVAEPGIYLLGIQGGVIFPDDLTKLLITENAIINYGYLNSADQLSLSGMEKQLDRYLEENIPSCLNSFVAFTDRGIRVTERGEANAKSIIRAEEILVRLAYKLDLVRDDDSLRVDSFSAVIPLPVGKVVDDARTLIENYHKNPPNNPAAFDLSSLLAADAFISAFPFDEATMVYSLSDKNPSSGMVPFTFMFAVRDYAANTPPRLANIADLVIRQGEQLTLAFTADDTQDDSLTFSSDSSRFPVSNEGVMDITAATIGTFEVAITVEDKTGLEDRQSFTITVIGDEE